MVISLRNPSSLFPPPFFHIEDVSEENKNRGAAGSVPKPSGAQVFVKTNQPHPVLILYGRKMQGKHRGKRGLKVCGDK